MKIKVLPGPNEDDGQEGANRRGGTAAWFPFSLGAVSLECVGTGWTHTHRPLLQGDEHGNGTSQTGMAETGQKFSVRNSINVKTPMKNMFPRKD